MCLFILITLLCVLSQSHALLIDLMEGVLLLLLLEFVFTITAFRALLFSDSGKTPAEHFYHSKNGKKSKTWY